jgi:hypothetical protein
MALVMQGCQLDDTANTTLPDRMLDTDPNIVWHITCPVLSGLFTSGKLVPNGRGQVSAGQLKTALQETGVSWQFAHFQSQGIMNYADTDVHQNERSGGLMNLILNSFFKTRYANLFTMQPADDCKVNPNGLTNNSAWPCNANPQNQQHGFSTTMRDRRFDQEDPDGKERFKFWIENELVDPPVGVEANEKVLLLDGLGRILAKAKKSANETEMFKGDFSGEYSHTRDGKYEGSNVQTYHKEISEEAKQRAISVWQPLLAWAGWWFAFSRPYGEHKSNAIYYFTKTDLEDFFLRGKFPNEWTKRTWGFQAEYSVLLAMKGMIGSDADLFTNMVEAQLVIKDLDWWNPEKYVSAETRSFKNVAVFFSKFMGIKTNSGDNTHNMYP